MPVVGQQPFPEGGGQYPFGQAVLGLHGGEECRHAGPGQQPCPVLQHRPPPGEAGVVGGGEVGQVAADEVGQDGGPGRLAARFLQRPEQGQPVAGGGGGEDGIGAGEGDRDPGGGQRGGEVAAAAVGRDQHRDVLRPQLTGAGRGLQPGAAGQQPHHLGDQIGVHPGPGGGCVEQFGAGDAPQPDRRRCGSEQAGALMAGGDRRHGDALAEGDVVEQGVDPGHHRRVRPVVDLQRELLVRGRHRLAIGRDVGAAETVDRLLGVTDQDQRAVAVEGALQDLPLHRVGVLELVDQHHLAAPAQPLDRSRCGGVTQRVPQPQQLVVEGEQAQPSLPGGELVPHC